MPIVDVPAIPQVATSFQNDDHRVEAELLNASVVALDSGGDVDGALEKLVTHTREHFAREDDAMRRTNFPPFAVHHEEHDHVLLQLTDAIARFKTDGDRAALRHYLAQDVVAWFLSHIQSMDTVTGRWLKSHS